MWETQVQFLVRKIPWRRKWQPTPVFLPGESHGQSSLASYRPWGLSCTQLSTKPPLVYICQLQSPNSSYPLSVPLGVHTFNVCLCLYFCFEKRFICIIFLDSTYKWYHALFVFPFLTSCFHVLVIVNSAARVYVSF